MVGGNKGVEALTQSCKRLENVRRDYWGFQGLQKVTDGYKGLRGLQEVRGGYMG